MSRASSVGEIRERLAEIQDAAPERALALLSAHAPQDIAYLLERVEELEGALWPFTWEGKDLEPGHGTFRSNIDIEDVDRARQALDTGDSDADQR